MKLRCAVLALLAEVTLSQGIRAAVISDPVGDFLPTLTALAPHAGDLDAVSSRVSLVGSNFLFTAMVNAPINTTPEAFYVWGIDRGAGSVTSNFSALGLPNIFFDTVLVVQNEGTGGVNDLTGVDPPVTLAAGAVTSSGNTIQALVPLSALPSRGLAASQYGWNLWPRWGGIPMSNAQISDFAPNTVNAQVDVVAEPSTWLFLSAGLIALGGVRRPSAR
jgi:hypothetical protein